MNSHSLEYRDPATIRLRKRAWRKYPGRQIAEAVRQLERTATVVEPPLIDTEGYAVCGGAIIQAARELGWKKTELAVSETLLLLAARSDTETNVRLRRLLGQRFDDLAAALVAAKGVKTEKASKALAEFRGFEAIRPILCHGADKIALDRHGQWVAVFKLVDLRAGEATRVSRAFEEREASDLLASLSKSAAELGSALQSLRDKLRPEALAN